MVETKLAKILKWFVYAIAFVPLVIFSQYISPFHFGKVVVFRSLVELALVFYLLLIWWDRSYRPRPNPVFWAFLSFTGAFTLTTLTSVSFYESFWGTLERMGGLWTFWHYFAYFLILTSVMRTEKDWFNLFKLVVFVGVLSAFYGFSQKTDISWVVGSGGRARIFGTIGNAALFAGYQIVTMFLALTLFFRRQNSAGEKYFFAAAAGINFIAVMMTVVRGSVLGVGVGLLVFTLLYARKFNSAYARRALAGLVLFVVVFFIFAYAAKNSDFVRGSGTLTRLTDFSLQSFTVQTRFWAWKAGIDGWNDSVKTIILGWGPENFNVPFSIHFNPKFYAGPGAETLFDRGHNMFVEVLVTMGVVGLIAYVSIFFLAFKFLAKISNSKTEINDFANPKGLRSPPQLPNYPIYGIGLTSLLVAHMIHNAFIFDTSANFIVFFTVLGFISSLTLKHDANNANDMRMLRIANSKGLNKTVFNAGAMVMLIVVSVLIYKTNVIPAKANYAATRGIVAGWQNDFNRASAKFREAIEYNTFGKYEIRHRYAQYLFEYSSNKEITPALQKEFEWNIEKVKEIAKARPMDYLPRLYISRMFIVLGKGNPNSPYNDEALKYSLEALDISPTFVRTYFEVAQAYLNKNDYNKAIEYFKKAVDLNPDVKLSHWYLGITEIQAGNVRRGLEIIEQSRYQPTDEADIIRLLNIYVKIKELDKVTPLYEKLVQLKPNNPNYRASLAAAYAREGRIDEAVAQAQEAVRLDPSFRAEAEAFVRGLGREF